MSRPITPTGAGTAQTGLGRASSQRAGYTASRPASHIGRNETGVESSDHYSGAPPHTSVLHDEDAMSDSGSGLQRTSSHMSQTATAVPSRGGTLKKRASLKKNGSVKRSGSKKSDYAGSVRSMRLGEKEKYEPTEEHNSAFYCPIPITGSPTELLADRFQAWRKVLKDLIAYFRDLQKSYDTRAKSIHSASNVLNNSTHPPNFMSNGGLAAATSILRDFHKLSLNESNKSKELENEVILQLTGLRSDLQQKIKEIKSLSGDFKNSVAKEQEATRKAVRALHESLGTVDNDAGASAGKGDPFLVKMSVDRQLEKQIEEENYLHRAYLNLEASGRELESIVVGEIQKAYNVLANIMKREADHSFETAEKLREGPIALSKDYEWDAFVTNNKSMVDPRIPLRHFEQVTYTGKDHPAAIEVKSGMLERKSKYLKNYTPGWYVLSPTHLHEFKSADKIAFQAPVMSLYLPEQKLGTQSDAGSSSHKFMLKGRQAGSMHRGHTWIFRAETHDTMLAWYNDIKELTERRGEARNEFVRRTHARTLSSGSMKAPSINSAGSGMEDDEADQVAFAGEQSIRGQSIAHDGPTAVGAEAYAMDDAQSESEWRPQRPTPGGRFPSDLNVQRGLQAPLSPSSGDSMDETDRSVIAAAGALPGSDPPFVAGMSNQPHTELHEPRQQHHQQTYVSQPGNDREGAAGSATQAHDYTAGDSSYIPGDHRRVAPTSEGAIPVETASTYGEWMAPIAAGVGGAGLGAAGAHAYHEHEKSPEPNHIDNEQNAIPAPGESSAPMAIMPAPTYTPARSRSTTDTSPPVGAPTAPLAMRDPAVAIDTANYAPAISRRDTDMSARSNAPSTPLATRDSAVDINAANYVPPYPRRDTDMSARSDGPSTPPATRDAAVDINTASYVPAYPRRDTDMSARANSSTDLLPTGKPIATTDTAGYTSTNSQREIDTNAPANAPTEPLAMRDPAAAVEKANNAPALPDSMQPITRSSATFSNDTATTIPYSMTGGVGISAPAPSQTLAAAGVNPNPTRTLFSSAATIQPINTTASSYDRATGGDEAGQRRPQLPHSAGSVATISDLHIPGEFPKVSASESGPF